MTINIKGRGEKSKSEITLAIAKVVVFTILLEVVFTKFAGIGLLASAVKGVYRCYLLLQGL